ncbi:MAG TPA: cyclase family protein [Candidatus Bathyarchaeia archaeon]|nr:cyclase family protein [Candidatus Bathyarchaeia archaeon]
MSREHSVYDFRRAIDLTHELKNGMPVYPGDPSPTFDHYSTLDKNGVNLTRLTMGSHTGTHLDAPKHFIADGIGIDQIPPSKLIGEAYVADLSMKPIGSGMLAEDLHPLEQKIRPDDMVVCYTGCSDHWEDEAIRTNFTYLEGDAAKYLVSKRVRAVGIDFLSVEKFGAPEPIAHKTLLGNGIFIIESLDSGLRQLVGQRVLMICMPIKLQDGDGAPSRVVAVPMTHG